MEGGVSQKCLFASPSVYPSSQRGCYTARSLSFHLDGGSTDALVSMWPLFHIAPVKYELVGVTRGGSRWQHSAL